MAAIEITLQRVGAESFLKSVRDKYEKAAEEALRKAVFLAQSIIVKDFMSVVDNGKGKRTFSPGVRTQTGNLKRSIVRGARFRRDPHGDLEGAIGTDVRYGEVLEEKTVYKFLMPGMKKAMPEIEKLFDGEFKIAEAKHEL